MTIACAYLVSDGFVLGADSTTTVLVANPLGQPGVAQLLNHAQKIFEVGPCDSSRMALCTWGAGRVGETSHRTLAVRLSDEVTAHPQWSVEEAARCFQRLVQDAARTLPGAPGVLGYFLGGIDVATHSPRCFEVTFVNGAPQGNPTPLGLGEVRFRGMPELFERAYRGFDPRLPGLLLKHLIVTSQQQVPPVPILPQLPQLLVQAFTRAVEELPHGGHQDVPIREAIDFCHMYLHLTIKGNKFRFGAPMCGGPIEVGFVTTDRHFRWARHKPFDSAIVEQDMGGDT